MQTSGNGKMVLVATSCVPAPMGGIRWYHHWKLKDYMERIRVTYVPKPKIIVH